MKEKRSEALKRAQAKYNEKRVTKNIFFNRETEADLLEAAAAIPNFAGWVKNKLREEIEKQKRIK